MYISLNIFKPKLEQNIKIKKIFDELQSPNTNYCIKPDRVLEPRKKLRSGFGADLSSSKICYDQNISGLNDNSIRFCLLHEEGHHNKGHDGHQLRRTICVGGVIIFSISLFIAPILKLIINLDLNQPITVYGLGVFLGLFISCISTSIAVKSLEMDEYVSDNYAAKKLRDEYSIKKPSEILETTFYELNTYLKKYKNDSSNIIKKIWNVLQEYHPTDPQRIACVKYKVDLK